MSDLFDTYDDIGTKGSLSSECTFCSIALDGTKGGTKTDVVLYRDDFCAIFADLRRNATAHYQCIPLRHIRNYTYLRLSN